MANDAYNQANLQVGQIHTARRPPEAIRYNGMLQIPPFKSNIQGATCLVTN